jgi:hypothetical protein
VEVQVLSSALPDQAKPWASWPKRSRRPGPSEREDLFRDLLTAGQAAQVLRMGVRQFIGLADELGFRGLSSNVGRYYERGEVY